MTFQVIVLEAAELDIEGSLRWYRERSRSAADGFRTEVIEAIDRIANAPLAWSTDEDGSHRYVLQRYPFTVIYDVKDKTIEVLAVAHHRKKPGYWLAVER